MKRITYISKRAKELTDKDVENIAVSSKLNNPDKDLSGVLLLIQDYFIQILEGPQEKLDLVFGKIKNDDRHTDLIVLKSEDSVSKRFYPNWSMRFIDMSDELFDSVSPIKQMILAISEARAALKAYTQVEVLNQFELGFNPLNIQPRKVYKTILFADIIGFTELTENLDIDAVISVLNFTFGVFSEIIDKYNGTVNKLIGDAILAYFDGDDTENALKAGMEMSERLEHIRQKAVVGDPIKNLHMGIGYDRGYVIEGNIGSYFKKDFTIIGDVVNSASRIEKLTRRVGHDILMSANMAEHLTESSTVSLGEFGVRGIQHKIELFTVAPSK
jgi:class 3 adenylate cyclase